MVRTRKEVIKMPIEHFDITKIDATAIIQSMGKMSFTASSITSATKIFSNMLQNKKCSIVLTIAGSTISAGCMKVYADMIKYNMVDAIVATGASFVDMDFFEAIGFRDYQRTPDISDEFLYNNRFDCNYETDIDEDELRVCNETIKKIADSLLPGIYSSREFIREMGKWLTINSNKKTSLTQLAYEYNVPIMCPAFSDSCAGFGLVKHQYEKPNQHVSIDSVKDIYELTMFKINAEEAGLFMIGGGVPKNFSQDSVVCAEYHGKKVPVNKHAVQIAVADIQDGACLSSTLKDARSWGRVGTGNELMVYSEATSVLPLIISSVFHEGVWKKRKRRELAKLFS